MKMYFSALALATVCFAFQPASLAQSYSFTTIAGAVGISGTANGTNDSARFSYPTGMAVDANGSIYLADRSSNHLIRKLTPQGTNWIVTTMVGSAPGFQDGINSGAYFRSPGGVAFDKAGNLYVADTGNSAIRKIVSNGTNWTVTTIAGGGSGPVIGLTGGADGTNRTARFDQPVRLVVDSATNIYVADYFNYAIRKISPDGTNWVTTTIAGLKGTSGNVDGTNTSARFHHPNGIALDRAENLYVSDSYNGSIRKLTPVDTNWIVTTIATGFSTPACVAIDRFDNIFVADNFHNQIKKLVLVGTNWVVTTIGGSETIGSADGVGSAAQFNRPDGIAVDAAGNIFVGDSLNRTMRLGKPFPALQLAFAAGHIIHSWGTWPTNFILESTGDLSLSNTWSQVNVPVEVTNNQNVVTLPIQNGNRFFRLKQP